MPHDAHMTIMDCLVDAKDPLWGLASRDRDPLIACISRDIEILLNVRRETGFISAEREHAVRSILNFGVPEFDRFGDLSSQVEQDRLASVLEEVIATYEPRLQDVRVRVAEINMAKRSLRLLVDAVIISLGESRAFELELSRRSGKITVGGAL